MKGLLSRGREGEVIDEVSYGFGGEMMREAAQKGKKKKTSAEANRLSDTERNNSQGVRVMQ